MTEVALFPHQEADVKSISLCFSKGTRAVLYQGATGIGKTVIFAHIAKKLSLKGKRVLILTDRLELIDGSAGALVRERIHPYIINAKSKRLNPSHSVYVAMSQTLKRRIVNPDYAYWVKTNFDFVIIDECHKEEFNFFFVNKCFGNAMILGVTATPRRRGKSRQLAMDYQVMINGQPIDKLIAGGWLCKPNYIEPDLDVEWGEMRTSQINGELDYRIEDVAKVMDSKTIYTGMIETMKAQCNGDVTIVFCSSSATTIKSCIELNEAGIPARYLISDPEEEEGKELHAKYKHIYSGERKALIRMWKQGAFKVMVNNGILTTGFDYPGIQTVVLNRRTMSENLMLQMCGRGSRIVKGAKSTFNIIDMADNFKRMKYWHTRRRYSLRHSMKKKGGEAPIKTCPKCHLDCYASQKRCDNIHPESFKECGYVFPTTEKKEVKVAFKVTTYADLKWNELTPEIKRNMSFDELEKYRRDNELPEGWVRFVARETGRLEQYKHLKSQPANA
jgi:superfamily II DNA or RNA helicase